MKNLIEITLNNIETIKSKIAGFYSESVFPRVNDLLTGSLIRHRKKVLLGAQGRILEIGFGSGLSLECYPDTVKEIIGLEPNPGMLKRAAVRTPHFTRSHLRIETGSVEALPFGESEFDGVVSFLTLCSVSDLSKAVSEMRRVLKPSGKLFFIEHTIQAEHNVTRAIQSKLNPLWNNIACGCNLDRDTLRHLKEGGFILNETKVLGYNGFPNFLSPLVRGIATKETTP